MGPGPLYLSLLLFRFFFLRTLCCESVILVYIVHYACPLFTSLNATRLSLSIGFQKDRLRYTMPPRRGTPWVSHSSLLSDRIRPHSGSTQPTKSEKGRGKAKAVTPEPPPRSDAVRKLDELLDGLRSSPTGTSNQQHRKATTGQRSAPVDREGCFCQGTSASEPLSFLQLPATFLAWFKFFSASFVTFRFPIQSIIFISQLEQLITKKKKSSPDTRIIRIHSPLLVLRSRPLRLTTSTPPLPTLQHAAPHAFRASSAL